MSKMPRQRPGRSEQDVCTPPAFLRALKAKLGIDNFAIDLAADEHNTVSPQWYGEQEDALVQGWVFEDWGFVNPPYSDIEPWVAKAWVESIKGARIAMLLPASTGSNWWAKFVHDKCYVLLLNGRITFTGHSSPYPKDLVTLLYTPYAMRGYDVWRWGG